MHRIAFAVCAAAAAFAAVTLVPRTADSAGVYEDAPAESAFLLSGSRIAVTGTTEYSSTEGSNASVYRMLAAFPLRGIFLVSIDQPFVALQNAEGVESGLGDLRVRARARVLGGSGHSLHLLGYLGGGTGNRRYFPYSSQTIDVNLSAGYADSLASVVVWAIAGGTWVYHVPENDPAVATHTRHWRASAGASVDFGPRIQAGLGALFLRYLDDAGRDVVFATGSFGWTRALTVFANVQTETGPVAYRVSDWTGIFGITVHF